MERGRPARSLLAKGGLEARATRKEGIVAFQAALSSYCFNPEEDAMTSLLKDILFLRLPATEKLVQLVWFAFLLTEALRMAGWVNATAGSFERLSVSGLLFPIMDIVYVLVRIAIMYFILLLVKKNLVRE